MIRVTVEMVSANGPERDRLLGVAYIANTGRGEHGRYTYEVFLSKWAPKEKEAWKRGRAGIPDDRLLEDQMRGEVVAFDRNKRGAWDLLFLALRAVIGSRNP